MLSTLRIKNLALVADLTLELQPGFNALTGETGAGKSIIIGALNLILGERADRSLIRSGCDSCTVEAVLDMARLRAPIKSFLEENGLEPCEAGQLVLKRVFTAAGANRQFINGSPATLNVLSALGQTLVDIHGPHDHQSLLQSARQLAILDAYGKLEKYRETFAELVQRRAGLTAEKAALIVDEQSYARQLELLRFQVNEITAAQLQAEEEAQLEQDFRRASHAALLLQRCQTALGLLGEAEDCLINQAGRLGRTLQEMASVDAHAEKLADLHAPVLAALQDLQTELSRYLDRIDLDPARLQEIEDRLNLIHALKRKYGSTLSDVITFGELARQKLQQLEKRETELERIQAGLRLVENQLWSAGQELTTLRRKIIPRLSKAAAQELADLGFPASTFDIAMASLSPDAAPAAFAAHGLDTIEFQFAPNVGEPARPLRAIASSGEMARVMLALKTVLASVDEIPILVFDEIDANVGGETTRVVGEKMRELGGQRQVLCITHLAPVAARASTHFVVTKQIKDGRTVSDIYALDLPGRIAELTRMLGGHFEAARRHAEALLAAQ